VPAPHQNAFSVARPVREAGSLFTKACVGDAVSISPRRKHGMRSLAVTPEADLLNCDSAASRVPRVDDGPQPDNQECAQRNKESSFWSIEYERMTRRGSADEPAEDETDGEADHPLHRLTIVETGRAPGRSPRGSAR
jgi:hypothetical protein